MSAPKRGNTILNLGEEMVETFDWDQLYIPLDKIDERPGFNPRTDYGEADGSFAALVESIRDRGMLELPRLMPVVDKRGDWDPVECRFTIIAGHRRIAAARALGWESIRACVPDADGKELAVYDDGQQLVDALIENLQRKELNCIEVAEGIARLEKLGKTQADIAKWIGRDQGRVSKTVRLLELPVGVRALLREGALSASHGEELLPLLSESFLPGEIYNLAQSAVDMSLTKSGLRNVVQDKIKRTQPVQTTIEDIEGPGGNYAPAHNSPATPSPRSEGGSDPKPTPKDDMERQQLPSSNGLTRKDSDIQFAAAMAPDPDVVPLSERPAPPAESTDVSERCWATHKMMTPQERQEWLFSKGLNTSRACDKLREVLEVPTTGFLGAVTLSEEGWALLRKLASVEPYTSKTDGTIVEALLLRRALELGIEMEGRP